jgi:hypothetical protein
LFGDDGLGRYELFDLQVSSEKVYAQIKKNSRAFKEKSETKQKITLCVCLCE